MYLKNTDVCGICYFFAYSPLFLDKYKRKKNQNNELCYHCICIWVKNICMLEFIFK